MSNRGSKRFAFWWNDCSAMRLCSLLSLAQSGTTYTGCLLYPGTWYHLCSVSARTFAATFFTLSCGKRNCTQKKSFSVCKTCESSTSIAMSSSVLASMISQVSAAHAGPFRRFAALVACNELLNELPEAERDKMSASSIRGWLHSFRESQLLPHAIWIVPLGKSMQTNDMPGVVEVLCKSPDHFEECSSLLICAVGRYICQKNIPENASFIRHKRSNRRRESL